MAFTLGNFAKDSTSGNIDAGTTFRYRGPAAETLAAIQAADYFAPVAHRLEVEDIIIFSNVDSTGMKGGMLAVVAVTKPLAGATAAVTTRTIVSG